MTHINLIGFRFTRFTSQSCRDGKEMYGKSVPPGLPRRCFATIAILTLSLPSLSSIDLKVTTVVTYSQTLKKKKESTSTVRMIIKLKEEDETGFLFSFRFNQFPLNGTLFRLKPARYLAFWETLFIILLRSQNRYLYPTQDKLAMSCTIAVYDHLT